MSAAISQPVQAGRGRPARTGLIVVAAIMMVIGVSAAIGGGVLLIAFGRDGAINSGAHPVSTPTSAVITDIASISNASELADVMGTPSVRLTANGDNTFIGIALASDIDRYLAGVAVDQATDLELDPYVLTLSHRDGTATATPPAEQTFWVASAAGPNVTDLTWNLRDGDYRAVMMNADGTAGIDTQLSLGFRLPGLYPLSLALLIGGFVLLVGGLPVLIAGLPRRGRSEPPTGPPVASPPVQTPL